MDENGQAHYGEQPGNPNAQEIRMPESTNRDNASTEVNDRIKDMQDWNNARQLEREQKKQREQEKQEKRRKTEEKCARLRVDLRDMEVGGLSWYDLDEKGERRYLDDKEVASRIVEMRKSIADHCE